MHEMNMYANAMHEMTRYEMHENENNTRRQDPNPRNKYNLAPETARVGYKYGKYIWGVTLVHVRLSAVAMSLNYGCHVGQL